MPETVTQSLPLLLPGTLCDRRLWQGVGLRGRLYGPDVVRGRTLAQAATLAMVGAPERFHLIGFSLGAILACELLRRVPERVARLTLIAFNPHAPTQAQQNLWAEQERQVRAGAFGAVVSALAPELREAALRVGPDTFLDQLSLLRSRPDSRPDLARYAGPLTLLVGENDAVTPPALALELQRLRPATRVRVVPGAGHFLPLEAPAAVAEALKAAPEAAYA